MKSKVLVSFFVILILFILTVNVISATNSSMDNTKDNVLKKDIVHKMDNIKVKNQEKENKTIYKNVKSIKKEVSQSYQVDNFQELKNALTNTNYDTVEVNIQKNIELESNITVPRSINKIRINGNNFIIDGNKHYSFLIIDKKSSFNSSHTLNINDLRIQNCQNGVLTTDGLYVNLYNVEVTNNIASENNIHIKNGKIDIINSIFSNNRGTNGGIILFDQSDARITRSSFISNSADNDGGALYFKISTFNITDSSFKSNKAESYGAALTGIAHYYGASYGSVYNVTFESNSVKNNGGAISFSGGQINITNSHFKSNKAGYMGGAFYATSTLAIIKNVTFEANTATLDGGAICQINGNGMSQGIIDMVMSDIKFINNTAKQNGGAFYKENAYTSFSNIQYKANKAKNGGGMYAENGYMTLNNMNFIENTATGYGGAICLNITGTRITNANFTKNTATSDGGASATSNSLLLI